MPSPTPFLKTKLGQTVVGSGAAVVVGAVAEHVLPHVLGGVGYVAKVAVGGVKRLFSPSPSVAGSTGGAPSECPCNKAVTGGTARVKADPDAIRDGVSVAMHAALDSVFPGMSSMLASPPPPPPPPSPAKVKSKCGTEGVEVGLVLPLPIPFLPDGQGNDQGFKEQLAREQKIAKLQAQQVRTRDQARIAKQLLAAKAATDKGIADVEKRLLAELQVAKDQNKALVEDKLRAIRAVRLSIPRWDAKTVKASQEPDWMQSLIKTIVEKQLSQPQQPQQAQQPQQIIVPAPGPWGFGPFGPGFPGMSPGMMSPGMMSPGMPSQQAFAPQPSAFMAPEDDGADMQTIADSFAMQAVDTSGGNDDEELEGFGDDDEAGGDDDEAGGDDDDESSGFDDDDEAGGDDDDESSGCGCAIS